MSTGVKLYSKRGDGYSKLISYGSKNNKLLWLQVNGEKQNQFSR